MRIVFVGLFLACALLGPLHAAETEAQPASPTMQDMVKWKSRLLSTFKEISYTDAESRPISEDVFFARVVNERRGFSMRADSEAPKHLKVRLLNDAEQQAAQPH